MRIAPALQKELLTLPDLTAQLENPDLNQPHIVLAEQWGQDDKEKRDDSSFSSHHSAAIVLPNRPQAEKSASATGTGR